MIHKSGNYSSDPNLLQPTVGTVKTQWLLRLYITPKRHFVLLSGVMASPLASAHCPKTLLEWRMQKNQQKAHSRGKCGRLWSLFSFLMVILYGFSLVRRMEMLWLLGHQITHHAHRILSSIQRHINRVHPHTTGPSS